MQSSYYSDVDCLSCNDLHDDLKKIEFVDLHSHLLPGIDDGAKDIDTSIEMLRIAQKHGITHIISTPHYIPGSLNNTAEIVNDRLSKVIEESENAKLKVNIYPGNEIFISPDIPDLVQDGLICTLNNSSYILIELPLMNIPPYTDDVFYNLQLKGYKPIIAHPERNSDIINDPNLLYSFIRRGILTQINSNSLIGIYGSRVRDTAFTLLKHSMIHFISTDAHSTKRRSPKLNRAFKLVSDIMGWKVALNLFSKNGLAVIRNLDIDPTEPDEIKQRKSYLISSLLKLVRTSQ